MSDIVNTIEIVVLVLAICVFMLQIFSRFNIAVEYKQKEMHSLNLLWLFHEEIYNDYGKGACKVARVMLYIALLLGVAWLMIYLTQK